MHCAGPKWLQKFDAETEVGQAAARLHKGLSRQRILNEHDLSDMRIAEHAEVFIFYVPQRANRLDTTVFQVWKSHNLVDADSALQIASDRVRAALAAHEYDWDGVTLTCTPYAFQVSIPLFNENRGILQYSIPNKTWVENVTPQTERNSSRNNRHRVQKIYRMEDSGQPRIRISKLEAQNSKDKPLPKQLRCIRQALIGALRYPTAELKADIKGQLHASFELTKVGNAGSLQVKSTPSQAMADNLKEALRKVICTVDLGDEDRIVMDLTIEYGIHYTYWGTY